MENKIIVNEENYAELRFYKLELKKLLKRVMMSEDKNLHEYINSRQLEDLLKEIQK